MVCRPRTTVTSHAFRQSTLTTWPGCNVSSETLYPTNIPLHWTQYLLTFTTFVTLSNVDLRSSFQVSSSHIVIVSSRQYIAFCDIWCLISFTYLKTTLQTTRTTSRGGSREWCPQMSDEIVLFCKNKQMLWQIGRLPRLWQCKEGFNFKGALPQTDPRHRFALNAHHVTLTNPGPGFISDWWQEIQWNKPDSTRNSLIFFPTFFTFCLSDDENSVISSRYSMIRDSNVPALIINNCQ